MNSDFAYIIEKCRQHGTLIGSKDNPFKGNELTTKNYDNKQLGKKQHADDAIDFSKQIFVLNKGLENVNPNANIKSSKNFADQNKTQKPNGNRNKQMKNENKAKKNAKKEDEEEEDDNSDDTKSSVSQLSNSHRTNRQRNRATAMKARK